MSQGTGFLTRNFGSGAKRPGTSSAADVEHHPDQHASVLRAKNLAWDEAKPDPRPALALASASALVESPATDQQLPHHVPLPDTVSKRKKKGFKQLFVKWKQQLANQLHPATSHSTETAPAVQAAPRSAQQDAAWQKQGLGQNAIVEAGRTQLTPSPEQHEDSSSTHHQASTASHGNTPSHRHAGATPTAAAYRPAAAAASPHRYPTSPARAVSATAAPSPASVTRHQALPVPEHGTAPFVPPYRSSALTTASQQQQQQQQHPLSHGSSSLKQQIEQLIAFKPAVGTRPAAAATLPWSAGQAPLVQPAATAGAAPCTKPAVSTPLATGILLPAGAAAAATVHQQSQQQQRASTAAVLTAQGTHTAAHAINNSNAAVDMDMVVPQDSHMASDAAALAVQFAAARVQPPWSQQSDFDSSAGRSSSAGVYVMPSSSSKEPALTHTSSAGVRSGSTASKSCMPGTHSHHVGSLANDVQASPPPAAAAAAAAAAAQDDEIDDHEEELMPDHHHAEAAAAAAGPARAATVPAVTDDDVALWLSRCAVLQEKLSGGLMAADGKLQALTARSQLVQGILVSLPQGRQRRGEHAHLVPKLHSERARIAAELSALKQRLQLLAVAINRLAAAGQYLSSQAGTAMAAGDRVAILQLVLADAAERLGIWDWEEVQGVAALGNTGRQIRDMLAAAASAAAAMGAAAAAGIQDAPSTAHEPLRVPPPPPAAAAAAGVSAAPAAAVRSLQDRQQSSQLFESGHAGAGSAPASTVGAATAAAAAAAEQRSPPARSASWHQPPAQNQQQQQYRQWPLYHPSQAGSPVSCEITRSAHVKATPPPAAAAAAVGVGAGGLNLQTLTQHNVHKAARHPAGLPPVPAHAAHAVAAAAAAGGGAGSSNCSRPKPAAPVVPAHGGAPSEPRQQQQQQASTGYYDSLAAAQARLALPSHATAAAAAASTAAAVHGEPEAQCTSEAAAASYAVNSGGRVQPNDELLLQYLGVSDSGSKGAADQAGSSSTTFVRSRHMPQHGASGGGVISMAGAAQQQQQHVQWVQEAGGSRGGTQELQGSSQREQYDAGYEDDSEHGNEERDESAQVSDDVWGTVNSIFTTANSNLPASAVSPSSSSFSQLTTGTGVGSSSAAMAGRGPRHGFGAAAAAAAASGRHSTEATRNRAAMLAESLSAAQLLVQQEDSGARDMLCTCFETLQQLVGAEASPAAAGQADQGKDTAAVVGSGSVKQHSKRGVTRDTASEPKIPAAAAAAAAAATSTAAADDDDDNATAELWESADDGRDSASGVSDEHSSSALGTSQVGPSVTLSPALGTSQVKSKSPPATASRHVHTFDSDEDNAQQQQQLKRHAGQRQQQQPPFDFGPHNQHRWQQQQQGEFDSAPWSSWAPPKGPVAVAAASHASGQQLAAGSSNGPGAAATAAGLPSANTSAAVFGRQSSISSSAGSAADVQFQLAGFSLTVRDLLQMLCHAIQAPGASEDIGSLPVSELIRQTSDVQNMTQSHSAGLHS